MLAFFNEIGEPHFMLSFPVSTWLFGHQYVVLMFLCKAFEFPRQMSGNHLFLIRLFQHDNMAAVKQSSKGSFLLRTNPGCR